MTGYSATNASFVESSQISNDDERGPGEKLDNETTGEKLLVVVGPLINAVAIKMKTFLI